MNGPGSNGMSLLVKTVTRWLKGFIFLFGAYIVLYGHLTPGGGFSGGVIIACAFVLLMLAEGVVVCSRTLPRDSASMLDCAGALILLAVAVAGLLAAKVFFLNLASKGAAHELLSGGFIPLSNIGIGLKVSMSLFLVFATLSAVHVAVKSGQHRLVRRDGDDEVL